MGAKYFPLFEKVQAGVQELQQGRLLQAWKQKHPQSYHFVLQRFSLKSFIGFPLTLVLLVAALQVLLLSEVTEDLVESSPMVQTDLDITTFLFQHREPGAAQFFYHLTFMGSGDMSVYIGIGLTVLLGWLRKWWAILAFWLVLGGMGLSVKYGKEIFERPRPVQEAYYVNKHFSFPSGHSATAVVVYGMVAYLAGGLKKSLKRPLVWGTAILLIGLIGFSRIYLGMHYFSDVVAGFMLGSLWLLGGITFLELMRYRQSRREEAEFTVQS